MINSKNKIYFIPGTMCDERLWTQVWKTLTPLLPKKTELIHLPIPSLESIDEITKSLITNIDDNSFIVGFSLGGYFASEIAVKHPAKVSKVLLVSNMSSALPEKENKERMRTIQWIKANGYTGIPDKRINDLLSPVAHNNENIKKVIKAMDNTMGKDVLLNQLDVTTKRANLLPKLCGLTCPIKFYVGDSDCLVKIERIESYINQTQQKNKSLEVIENTGHMLPLEQPDELAHTIAKYFTDSSA